MAGDTHQADTALQSERPDGGELSDAGLPDGGDVLDELLDATSVLAVSPPPGLAESLLVALHERRLDVPTHALADGLDEVRPVGTDPASDGRTVRLLLDERDVETAFSQFRRAALTADLTASGLLSIRTVESLAQRVTLTDSAAYAHVTLGDGLHSLDARDESFRGSLREEYTRRWEAAARFDPDVPAQSRLLATFAEQFPDAGGTLAAILGSDDAIPRSGEFDPITAVVLAAARHELQTLEVSDWAEGIGLSSRTEISRVTSRLSNRGIVETDRVPHGVGRPRQKLVLDDERVADCPPETLVATAREVYEADDGRETSPSVGGASADR
jgi:hypothetical protein